MNQNQMALEKMRKTQENLQKRKAELEELINSEGYAKAMDKMEKQSQKDWAGFNNKTINYKQCKKKFMGQEEDDGNKKN